MKRRTGGAPGGVAGEHLGARRQRSGISRRHALVDQAADFRRLGETDGVAMRTAGDCLDHRSAVFHLHHLAGRRSGQTQPVQHGCHRATAGRPVADHRIGTGKRRRQRVDGGQVGRRRSGAHHRTGEHFAHRRPRRAGEKTGAAEGLQPVMGRDDHLGFRRAALDRRQNRRRGVEDGRAARPGLRRVGVHAPHQPTPYGAGAQHAVIRTIGSLRHRPPFHARFDHISNAALPS
jgi:hypothetical protein